MLLLVVGFAAGLWLLLALRAPYDVLGVYAALPVVLPLGLLALVNGLAWVARRLRV